MRITAVFDVVAIGDPEQVAEEVADSLITGWPSEHDLQGLNITQVICAT